MTNILIYLLSIVRTVWEKKRIEMLYSFYFIVYMDSSSDISTENNRFPCNNGHRPNSIIYLQACGDVFHNREEW